MAPDWLDGDEVHFRDLDENEDYQIDEDYFIKTATFSTFARCVATDESAITIEYIDDSRRQFVIERNDIERSGIALHTLVHRRKEREAMPSV